jgi:N-acetyltransferase
VFDPIADPRPGDGPWPDVLWPVPESTVLDGTHVRLSLAREDDVDELYSALDDDEVWAHVRGRPSTPLELADSLAAARSNGRWPWIVRQDGRVVGTTSYLEVVPVDARLEIGFTLYARSVWGTVVNPECKLLLMQWAFEQAGFGRVQLKTDIRNARSQAAIARLGASYEGVLRRYQRRQDGSIRDTVLFSVTIEEWPLVKEGLLDRLR